MSFEVKIPTVGESITEGILLQWFKKEGDIVQADDDLFELETDKITLPVKAEKAGVLHILVPAGKTVQIGQQVATLLPSEKQFGSAASQKIQAAVLPSPNSSIETVPAASPLATPSRAPSIPLDGRTASPAGRFALEQYALSAQDVQGTGKDGRIMKGDVLSHLQQPTISSQINTGSHPLPSASPSALPAASPPAIPSNQAAPVLSNSARQRREKMTPIRKRIAERLVQSQHTAAILTTFNEVDLTQAMAWRKRHQEAFEKRHGVKLGFMSFFVKAVVTALKDIPEVNAHIDGDEVVYNQFYDIGIAVGTPKGLVVPVVRDADQLGFAGVEKQIADLAKKARDRKLTLDDLSGGSFTITNGGVYGSLISTPILNPPQSAILGMHGIKKRPMVIDDKIEIRPMMYLALSYDHRLIDGKEAVTFLRRIIECVEEPERMLLEV